mgnify:CR=1
MSLSFSCSFVCVVLFCSLLTPVEAGIKRIVTGYTANSVIMNLNPGTLENGDEYGIKVDMW